MPPASRRNPLLVVDARERVRLRDAALQLVALLLLVPLVRALFLGFLQQAPDQWAEVMAQVALRFAFVVVGWLSLDTFSALIRGEDREVLAILPVDPGHVVVASLVRVARARWPLVPAAALLLLPVATAGAPVLWAQAVAFVAGAWALGLTVSAAVHLGAVQLAEDPRAEPLLDLVRGNNPRAQAAFLYAPGAALLLGGGLLAQASSAFTASPALATVWLAVPFVAATAVGAALPRLGRATWFRASAVLAEIDARYAALADPDEGHRVYLDWAIRGLPAPVRRYALDDLRHGWRARRTGITGAWLVGLAGIAAAWTADPTGPSRAWVVAAAGTWLCASTGVLLAVDEPPFLRVWMPRRHTAATLGRGVALGLWLQPCVGLPAAALLLRHGVEPAVVLVLAGEVAVVGATSLALLCGRLAERGMAVYGPVAAVAAAVFGLAGSMWGSS